ncbi:hypothetical protein JR316_0002478 [Psilocybe cubensis]|uniref:Uncharacterized protein n=1 Tax=Psilocybe cubensis TaxID=181762 RepID=A0ACB8HC35_PSICU|nr:hypothetical protein JR316_0002478 [Psilocybe cubensis]KAH9485568.1 hypothetical protein JR316_0002478 [Psilocybe cubensis]
MKRQADKQIARDDREEEEIEENPGQGFKKADENVLATRVIRGLPKRGGARAPDNIPSPTSSPLAPASTPGITTFNTGPIGTPVTSSPFSTGVAFKTTTETGDKLPNASNNFFSVKPSFSPFTTTLSQPSSGFSPSSNPFSNSPSSASNTSKTFASIISNSSTANPLNPTPQTAHSSSSAKPFNDSVPEKYYTDLRGLNTSVLSAITKTVESDPFIDISELLEQYKTLRLKIQKDFDESSSLDPKPTPKSDMSAPVVSNTPAMPVPPASFTGFNAGKTTTMSPTPATTGSPKSSLFDFKAIGSGASNPFAVAKDATATPSVFGNSSSTTPIASSATPPPTVPSFFAFSDSSTKTSTSSPFGTFGNPAPSVFNVGGTSTSTSNTKSVFGSLPTKATTPFGGFGSTPTDKSDKPTSFNPFGGPDKPPGSFTFGKPSPSTEAPKTASLFGSGNSASTFGGEKSSTENTTVEKPTSDDATPQTTVDNASPTTTEGADPATSGLMASINPHDEDGEGEENEETTHSSRLKAYKLTKDAEGSMKWVNIGSGLLKLKKDKTSGARRVLLRNSTNGKVIMNFNLYSGLKPTQTKNSVTFMGHDAGTSQTYSVRMPTETDAQELKGALEREIAFVKAKEP